jgi:hypothetical protein
MSSIIDKIQSIIHECPTIDKVGAEERVARFQTRSIKGETKLIGLKMALSMIDLTTLEGKDTTGKVKQMCYKAEHLHDAIPDLPTVAAVCVYPSMVKVAKTALRHTNIKVASVATAFPGGQSPLTVKIADTKFAVDEGADEVDMVISRGKFMEGDYAYVYDENCYSCRSRFHQDFNRKNSACRYHACDLHDVDGHKRPLRQNRNYGRNETCRWDFDFKVGIALFGNGEGSVG